MAKKSKKTKLKIHKNKNNISNKKNSELKAIEILKKNLLEKSNNNKIKTKKIKTTKKKKKEKEKEKEKQEELNLQRLISSKSNKSKKKEDSNKIKLNGPDPVVKGNLPLKRNRSKKKLSSLDKKNNPDKSQTLLQMIKNKKNLEEIKLKQINEEVRINIIKSKKKDPLTKETEENQKEQNQKEENKKEENQKEENKISTNNNKKNEENDKNEFIRRLKSRIVMVNGKMTIEKPDVGLISKKYNEEHNKHIAETIFVSNEDKKITSLSFLKKEKTKKWSEEETQKFYKALELFGLDFSFLTIVLSPRRREEIKRKYLKEKRKNPKEIERAIFSRKNVSSLNKVLSVYKNEKNENNLGLVKEESFSKKKGLGLKEEIDYDKEYKNILDKI